jgi:NAD(P)H-hydrate epimerase
MILSCAAMKALEEKAFAAGVSPELLMEQAGQQMALAVRQFFPNPGVCLAGFGKGNNGGDALVTARHLAAMGWEVRLIPAFAEKEWGPLPRQKFKEAAGCHADKPDALQSASGRPLIVLDGLLGIGAKGALQEPVSSLTRAINQLRATSNAHVFALDLPTGLDGDTGAPDQACIVADTTLTVGFAKQGLVADHAANFVGCICVLTLNEFSSLIITADTDTLLTTPANIGPLMPRRNFDTHKGDYGRIGIVAGSPGFLGAAVICANACVRAGAGLVTLYSTPDYAESLARMAPPEVMVQSIPSLLDVLSKRNDVFAIGPGLGTSRSAEIAQLVEKIPQPSVVDADALNAIAGRAEMLSSVGGERVLTPHPGEMERLDPDTKNHPRSKVVHAFAQRYPRCTLLLKGARTIVGKSGEPLCINTTGTPGMAVGGMGDALTGVIAALIGQRIRPFDAARIGAWLCGRASENAIYEGGETEETLTPTRMLDFLSHAFRDLRARAF